MPKKVIVSARGEKAEYFCEISGQSMDFAPEATVSVGFGYGSSRDGLIESFYLKEAFGKQILSDILNLIKQKKKEYKGE